MGEIKGNWLEFNQEESDEGIFLVPAGLASGDYSLEVRVNYGDTLRNGKLASTLSVTW